MAWLWMMLTAGASCPLFAVAEWCGTKPGDKSGNGPCRVEGPATPAAQPAWLAALKADRRATVARIGYRGGVFDTPELKWTQTAFVQPQMHPFDLFFYDANSHNYTVSRYLDDVEARYGGIDGMLMWPTYPNLGADDRNQFDIFRSLPGGLDGLARVTQELREAGVRVLWPYLTWDTGTRREPASDAKTIVGMLKATGGAGLNGDSIPFVPREFWDESVGQGHPLALQAEGDTNDPALNWSTLGWGYWGRQSNPGDAAGYRWTYGTVPLVDRFKFVTEGKWMTNICERYAKNKTNDLHMAWFNGIGFESWENVWGAWNGIVARDGELIRRYSAMSRFWGRRGLLTSAGWEPHAPVTVQYGVFASKWPSVDDAGNTTATTTTTLYSVVNRAGKNLSGVQVVLDTAVQQHFYDCYHGVPLTPVAGTAPGGPSSKVTLAFDLEIGGVGCVAVLARPADAALLAHLTEMRAMTSAPLSRYNSTWAALPQTLVPSVQPGPPLPPAGRRPVGTVPVPRANFTFVIQGGEIEGDDALGVDVQYPWESNPRREHAHSLTLGPFLADRFPVTCSNYSAFLQKTGYAPRDPHNWLKSWDRSSNGSPVLPAALANKPVTHVGISEARGYCAWAGGRLPYSYEWSYMAQGGDGREYPWGPADDAACRPKSTAGNVYPGPDDVDAHSSARCTSPFGVADLVGNTWEFTDEFRDRHTRAAVLRGGSNYNLHAHGGWYFPVELSLTKHQKYHLMDDSYERAGTIGFRCVYDVAV